MMIPHSPANKRSVATIGFPRSRRRVRSLAGPERLELRAVFDIGWTNQALATDVNVDGVTNGTDAQVAYQQWQTRGGSGSNDSVALPAGGPPSGQNTFVDVDGDGFISYAGDIQTILNVLVKAKFTLEALSTANVPITQVQLGDDFLVKATVQDVRPIPGPHGENGVFAASMDLVSSPGNLGFKGPITFGSYFNFLPSWDASSAGTINEIIASQDGSLAAPGTAPHTFFTARFHAGGVPDHYTIDEDSQQTNFTVLANDNVSGSSSISGNAADILPGNDTIMIDPVDRVAPSNLSYLGTSLTYNTPASTTSGYTITAVSSGSKGGAVSVAAGGKSVNYQPAADVNGTETYTYTIADGTGRSDIVTVTVTIREKNDAPTAGTDTRYTPKNTPLTISAADLLLNDAPGASNESSQTLTIQSVAATSAAGGTVQFANGQITYTPPTDFSGVDTIGYVIRDNGTTNGLSDPKTASGTIEINVNVPSFKLKSNPYQTVTANTGLQTVAGFATDITPAGDGSLAFSLSSDNAALFSVPPAISADGTLTYTPAPNKCGTATVSVALSNGVEISATQDFTIAVLPKVSIAGGSTTVTTVPGLAQAISFSVTPLAGSSVPFSFTVNWGDGSQPQTLATSTATHIYTAVGNRTISVTAQSGNLSSAAASRPVSVVPAAVISKVLYVGGTKARDVITLTPVTAANGKTLRVMRGGVDLGTFVGPTSAVVFGMEGNDSISLVSGKTATNQAITPNVSVQFFGEAGNDSLSVAANAAPSILVGGSGNDVLAGSSGRDILVGGQGSDKLDGNGGDDILVAGATTYDDNAAALNQLLAIWAGTGTYASRRDLLYLAAPAGPKLNRTTTLDDAVVDTLLGDAGRDWFIASTTGLTKDKISDRVASESVTRI